MNLVLENIRDTDMRFNSWLFIKSFCWIAFGTSDVFNQRRDLSAFLLFSAFNVIHLNTLEEREHELFKLSDNVLKFC